MSTCSSAISDTSTAKRKRGRIPGSRNKPKLPVAPATCTPAAIHPHVLQIPAGGDVAETVAAFASGRGNAGLCVLSATGAVAAAVLWEASSSFSSKIVLQGRFDLLSMTATFLPGGGEGTLAVALGGPQGQFFGGVVAGPVVAAATVIVVAATYVSPEFYCANNPMENASLPLFPEAEEDLGKTSSSVVAEVGGVKNDYFKDLELFLDMDGEDGGDKITDEIRLEQYSNWLKEDCIASPADGAVRAEEEVRTGMDGADLFVEGSDGGGNMMNMWAEQDYDLFPAAEAETALAVCGEFFDVDSFGPCGIWP